MSKNTTYQELCDSVFSKIKDYGLAGLDKDTAFSIILEYLDPAILMFSGCAQDLDDRDDKLGEFNFCLSNKNFQILSNYMVICYLDANYIRTGEMLKSHLSSTDFHKYAFYQRHLGQETVGVCIVKCPALALSDHRIYAFFDILLLITV